MWKFFCSDSGNTTDSNPHRPSEPLWSPTPPRLPELFLKFFVCSKWKPKGGIPIGCLQWEPKGGCPPRYPQPQGGSPPFPHGKLIEEQKGVGSKVPRPPRPTPSPGILSENQKGMVFQGMCSGNQKGVVSNIPQVDVKRGYNKSTAKHFKHEPNYEHTSARSPEMSHLPYRYLFQISSWACK